MNGNLYDDIVGDILLVDDQYENLKVLGEILDSVGYKTRKAIDGETAILAINSKLPDLILLDVMMPNMDGYAVCQELKSNPLTADIPIIFLTALDDVVNKVKAFKLGGNDYIVKPFQLEEVVVRVKTQITIKRQKTILEQENQKLRQVQNQLSQSLDLLNGILTSCQDGIIALLSVRNYLGNITDFVCILINPALAKKLGKKPEEINGKVYCKRFIDRINNQLFWQLVQVIEKGNPLDYTFSYKQQNKINWYSFTAVKLRDGLAITIHDITEIKKAELALKKSNQTLKLSANLDGLTQVYNRRYFDKTFESIWKSCQARNYYISLIFIDIDYFKQYNDTYGHLVGDECLYKVAKTIEAGVTPIGGIVARYGGEEFVVILPETNQKLAKEIGEEIRMAVKNLQIPHSESAASDYITISLGLATEIPHTSSKNLLSLADQALYIAKNQGRDRLISAEVKIHPT